YIIEKNMENPERITILTRSSSLEVEPDNLTDAPPSYQDAVSKCNFWYI
ncbi:17670_t:CDS:1, partial [Dentiscutata erythropus]